MLANFTQNKEARIKKQEFEADIRIPIKKSLAS